MEIRRSGKRSYFAASNSRNGFFSYYPECFDRSDVDRVWAVKGGPGTGKSRFLCDLAEASERRGWRAEYIYCSSDPDSLDGVILSGNGRRIALLDATAPHLFEPSLPGAREEIVNLGEFWNGEALAARKEEIRELNEKKKAAYRTAYRFLSAYGELSDERDAMLSPYLRSGALRTAAAKLLREVPPEDAYSAVPALIHSVGMRGRVALDTYFAEANRRYLIEDCRGSAWRLLRELLAVCAEKRLRVRVSYDPVLPDHPDGLFLCGSGIAFVTDAGGMGEGFSCRRIRMRTWIDVAGMREIRLRWNHTEQLRRAMLGEAEDALARVREYHFGLEKIYSSAMDFEAKEAFTARFCRELFRD